MTCGAVRLAAAAADRTLPALVPQLHSGVVGNGVWVQVSLGQDDERLLSVVRLHEGCARDLDLLVREAASHNLVSVRHWHRR